jgi:hypothetical protein
MLMTSFESIGKDKWAFYRVGRNGEEKRIAEVHLGKPIKTTPGRRISRAERSGIQFFILVTVRERLKPWPHIHKIMTKDFGIRNGVWNY